MTTKVTKAFPRRALHPQQRYPSPADILQQFPFPPAVQYPDLKLGQIVHRRKPTPLTARDSDGLQILPIRPPGDYQELSSRIHTQDSPVEYLLASPQPSLCRRSSTTRFPISTIHSSIQARDLVRQCIGGIKIIILLFPQAGSPPASLSSRTSASSSRWICFEIPQHSSFIHYS